LALGPTQLGGPIQSQRDSCSRLHRIERRPPRLDMAIYPYLPKTTVATTSARSYMDLLAGAA